MGLAPSATPSTSRGPSAERLGVSQANVAKIGKRSDLLVSTLRSYLAALGGEVRIVVSFDGRDVELSLDALEKAEAYAPGAFVSGFVSATLDSLCPRGHTGAHEMDAA